MKCLQQICIQGLGAVWAWQPERPQSLTGAARARSVQVRLLKVDSSPQVCGDAREGVVSG